MKAQFDFFGNKVEIEYASHVELADGAEFFLKIPRFCPIDGSEVTLVIREVNGDKYYQVHSLGGNSFYVPLRLSKKNQGQMYIESGVPWHWFDWESKDKMCDSCSKGRPKGKCAECSDIVRPCVWRYGKITDRGREVCRRLGVFEHFAEKRIADSCTTTKEEVEELSGGEPDRQITDEDLNLIQDICSFSEFVYSAGSQAHVANRLRNFNVERIEQLPTQKLEEWANSLHCAQTVISNAITLYGGEDASRHIAEMLEKLNATDISLVPQSRLKDWGSYLLREIGKKSEVNLPESNNPFTDDSVGASPQAKAQDNKSEENFECVVEKMAKGIYGLDWQAAIQEKIELISTDADPKLSKLKKSQREKLLLAIESDRSGGTGS